MADLAKIVDELSALTVLDILGFLFDNSNTAELFHPCPVRLDGFVCLCQKDVTYFCHVRFQLK